MRILNITYFKNLLEQERVKIIFQLKKFARRSPKNNDWEIKPVYANIQESEDGEISDKFRNMERDLEVEKTLEVSLNEVDSALSKIEKGTYGICEKLGEEISEERLKANPTAKTCIEH